MPRTMPSVLPRATQRTRPPPRCCCTSPVRFDLDALLLAADLHGIVDGRQLIFGEFGVEGGADDLGDAADVMRWLRRWTFWSLS